MACPARFSPVTAADGTYSATVDYGFSGAATPTLAGYTFDPPQRTYSDVAEPVAGQDFAATLNTYTVSVEIQPPGAGVVHGAGNYSHGEMVVLTARSHTSWRFVRWLQDGLPAGTNSTLSFSIDADVAIVAEFEAIAVIPTLGWPGMVLLAVLLALAALQGLQGRRNLGT